MIFLMAFIVCGLICVAAQVVMEAFELKPPLVLNLVLGLGGVLTPCGLMGWLDAVGGGGFLVAICGAGNALEQAGELATMGVPFMLIVVCCLFVVTTLLGMAAGEIRHRLQLRKGDASERA